MSRHYVTSAWLALLTLGLGSSMISCSDDPPPLPPPAPGAPGAAAAASPAPTPAAAPTPADGASSTATAAAQAAPDASPTAPAAASGAQPGATPVPAATAAPAAAHFVYSPVGRRDPFRSYLSQVKERQDAKARDHRREETENFEVSQFRLTGLVTGTTQPKAMVDDPNGEGHVLRIGSRIGKNGGRVYSINAQGLTIVEEYLDGSGKLVSVPVTVRLPDEVVHRPEGPDGKE